MAAGNALVSGARPRVDTVAEALRRRGFDVAVASEAEGVGALAGELAPGSLQCYVQLPGDTPAHGETVVERVRNFLVDGLIARFGGAAAVVPALAPGAVVLLVAGNHPQDSRAPDNHEARLALLDTLATCLVIERAGEGLRPLVVRAERSDGEIAELAVDPRAERAAALNELVEERPDALFSDWRDEILGLTHTYT
jgi:hypothetical protein